MELYDFLTSLPIFLFVLVTTLVLAASGLSDDDASDDPTNKPKATVFERVWAIAQIGSVLLSIGLGIMQILIYLGIIPPALP